MKHLFSLLALLAFLPLAGHAQDNHPKFPDPYDSAHFSWRKPVPRNRLRPLRPDRPGITESPFTVDAGHLQIETDLLRLVNEQGGEDDPQRRTWHTAFATVKLGLSRKTDLQLEVPLYSVEKQRPTGNEEWENQRGFGDLTVRLKHNFLGDDQEGPLAASVIGYVRMPTGAAGVSDARTEYGLVLPVNVEVGDTYNLEAQLETVLNYDPEQGERFWRLTPSVALDREFGKKLGLLVEGAFPWDSQDRRWNAQLNVQVDIGTHVALNGRTDRQYFVGFTIRR
jgi:hypothetical protein